MIRIVVTGFTLIVVLAGCGGDFGTSVSVSPERYQPIRPQADAQAVVFPGPEGFAIHDKTSQQNPGPSGTAASTADARPDGTASCNASVSQGGSASSSFILGAALRNDSNDPLPVAVTCDIEYDYTLHATATSGGQATKGDLALVMEAREQNTGKLLFQHPLATLSGYEDNVKRSDQQRVQLAATISPTASWRIVLQGKAGAESSKEGKAEVQLRVTRCQMTVKPLPAPASQQVTR
jgi:hypothetical protein